MTLCWVICFLAGPTFGQPDHKLDSLLHRLDQAFESDSLQAIAYEDVIWYYIALADSQKTWSYLDSLKSFGIRADYPYTELLYEFNVAYYYFLKSMYDSSIVHMQTTAHLADELDYPKQKVNALFRLTSIYKLQGEIDSAIICVNQATQLAVKVKHDALIADALNMRAGLEQDQSNYLLALKYYFAADSLYEKLSVKRALGRGNNMLNIAIIHHEQLKNHGKALNYIELAKKYYQGQFGSAKHSLASADLILARIHTSLGNLTKADSVLNESLTYFRSIVHPEQTARAAMLLGGIKLELNQENEAESLLLEAAQLYEELGNPKGRSSTHSYLGDLYKKKQDPDRSIYHLREALRINPFEDHRVDLLRELAYRLAENGKISEGFDSLTVSVELADSLNATQIAAAMQELETKYQTAQKEKEIVDLKLVQSQQAIKNQRILIWSSLGVLALLALSFFYIYRSRQKTKLNKQLRELDELKSKLFSDISHEFRTPLSLIKGPVEVLTQQLEDRPDVQQELSIVHRNASKLNRLVDSVQNLAKLDAGKMTLRIRPANLFDHLKIIGASFESMAASKNLAFHLDLDIPNQSFYYDPQHLETILYNLLSNAFKFTSTGEIKLKAEIEDGHALIKVSDTGIGLSDTQQHKIFERYYRADTPEMSVEGVGIGLALAHELAKLHDGSLQVQSALSQGSTFSLIIPVTPDNYLAKGLEIGPEFLPSRSTQLGTKARDVETPALIDKDESVILIVEDNPDMRQHLETLFKDEYSIIQAKDGIEGLQKSQQFVPDIIVSDLMMPVMDGQDFLKAVKTDPKTSHIPFIMLTANHLEQEKIKGLEQRVDDYMTKPFSIDEIKLKVNNLIHLREQLRLKYQQSDSDAPAAQPINETEARFWTQLQDVVQQNLDNADFSADDFAKAMFMSRMQLHRKLKALTNLSTTLFLRNERLKVAKRMLQKPDAKVAHVAYDVGFSSPSFFSKCFKEHWKMSPSEYGELRKTKKA